MSPVAQIYRTVHTRLLAYPGLVATVFLFVWATAVLGMYRLELDLSFRPFFVSSETEARQTKTFETVFGQPSSRLWSADHWISSQHLSINPAASHTEFPCKPTRACYCGGLDLLKKDITGYLSILAKLNCMCCG